MNIEIYKKLKNAYMMTIEELYPNSYEEYIANNYQLTKDFIKESTILFYNSLWECFSEFYSKDIRAKKTFEYIAYSIPIYSEDTFTSYFISRHNDLVAAVRKYIENVKPNLKFHQMRIYTNIYDEDLLLQMLTLDGITCELNTYENSNNEYLRVKITKEKLEEHINKAKELSRWMNRDGEDEEKRQVLLRNLQKE